MISIHFFPRELKTLESCGWSVALKECKDLSAVAFGDVTFGRSSFGASDEFLSNLTFLLVLKMVADADSVVIFLLSRALSNDRSLRQ